MKVTFKSVVISVTLLTSAPCFAGESPSAADIKRAAAAFDKGRDAIEAEEYVEAAERFEAADAYAPSATALKLAIAARMEAGHLARAASLAALALERHGDDEEIVESANSVIAEASASLHRIDVRCDDPCDLVLDNKIVHGSQRSTRTVFVNPGTHTLRASWSGGRNSSESIEAFAGGSSDVEFEAQEVAAEADLGTSSESNDWPSDTKTDPAVDSTGDSAKGWSPVVFWTGVGVTAVGSLTTVILGVKAQNEPGADAVREGCVGQGTSCELYQEGLSNQRNANIALGVTAAAGAFTVVTGLFLTDWGNSNENVGLSSKKRQVARSGLSVQPWLGIGDGATLGASGTF